MRDNTITQETLKEYNEVYHKLDIHGMNVIAELEYAIECRLEDEVEMNEEEFLKMANTIKEWHLKDESGSRLFDIAQVVVSNWDEIKDSKDLSIRQMLARWL